MAVALSGKDFTAAAWRERYPGLRRFNSSARTMLVIGIVLGMFDRETADAHLRAADAIARLADKPYPAVFEYLQAQGILAKAPRAKRAPSARKPRTPAEKKPVSEPPPTPARLYFIPKMGGK